jgi:hypothetical protein
MAIQSVKRLRNLTADKRGSEKIARKSFSPLPPFLRVSKGFPCGKIFILIWPPRLRGFAFFLISVHPRKSAANLFFFSVSQCLRGRF